MMIKPDLCFYNLALRTLTVDVKESSFVFQAYPPILASHWSGMTRLVYLFSLSNKQSVCLSFVNHAGDLVLATGPPWPALKLLSKVYLSKFK